MEGARTQQPQTFVRDVVAVLRDEFSSWGRPNLGEAATVFLSAATLIVLMGGLVYWIRAGNAGLPQVQTLSVISRQELVVVGVRQLVAPILITFGLSVVGFGVGAAAAIRSAGRRSKPAEGTASRKSPVYWGVATFSLGVLISGPFAWTTFAVVATLLLFTLLFAVSPLSLRVFLIAAVWSSFVVTLAGEADAGNRFESASIRLEKGSTIDGSYLAATGGTTYLGREGRVEGIPDRRIARISIGHAPSDRSPPRSIADRVVDLIGGFLFE